MTHLCDLSAKWARLLVSRLKPFIPLPVRTALNPMMTPIIRASQRQEDQKLEIEPSDVFLVSFPRSGNTWMRHMLTMIHPGLGPTDERDIHGVIPSLDARAELKPDFDQAPSPRVIKSHGPFNARYPRVIYLLRDGRDVTYSYYVYTKRDGYTSTFRDFLTSKGTYGGCSWHEHVESWLSRKHETPLLLIRYEDMLADPELQLRRAIDFLGWVVSDQDVKRSVAESSIDRMREKEESGVFLAYVRQGRAREWRQAYSDEQLEIFMNYSASTLRRFEYTEK